MFAVVEITTEKQLPQYDIFAMVTVSNNVDLSKVNVSWISEGDNMSMPSIEERHGEIIKSHIVATHSQLPVKLAVRFEGKQIWTRDVHHAELLENSSGEI